MPPGRRSPRRCRVRDAATTAKDVRWSTACAALGPERAPFLIEHEPAGAEWGLAARAAREAFRHPGGGVVRLAGIELPVADAAAVAREYGTVLGIAFSEGWRASVGNQWIALREGAGEPVVELAVESGTAPTERLSSGIRWRIATAGS
jgi:hypothetical protein